MLPLLAIRMNAARRTTRSRLCACAFVLFVLALRSGGWAQKNDATKESEHQTESSNGQAGDTWGRGTPHGTLVGFLHAAQYGNYDDASQYLQLSRKEKSASGQRMAQQLHALLDQTFVGRIGAV